MERLKAEIYEDPRRGHRLVGEAKCLLMRWRG